jgi:hypothetical protein
MGFRTKRRARRLPDLIEKLEEGRGMLKQSAESPAGQQRDEEHRRASGNLLVNSDKLIREAHAYHEEFQEQGAISDPPEFDDWYKHADAFANITKMTPDEYRRMRAETDRLPGGH